MALLGRSRDERGATAVLFALLALVLAGAGAFAVDMGQVYAKRSALQSNVDLAVLAAAAELDGGACTPAAVAAAEAHLTTAGNEVDGQIAVDLGGTQGDDDGFIQCTGWRVELWAPKASVEFGLARALSEDNTGVNVPAYAAAEIMSPADGSASMPMYAVSGCDSGSQTITDPPPGPAEPAPIPPLVPTTATTNNATFTLDPTQAPSGSTTPFPLTLNGNRLTGTTKVGFTSESGEHFEVAAPAMTVVSNAKVTLSSVPAQVLASEQIWYVRVFKDAQWSPTDDAQPFVSGDLLFCDGAISGNFGTLRISRSEPNNWLEHNIMFGIEPTLALYPNPGATSCEDGVSPAVTSEHSPPQDGTNCLGTDPGFPNAAATEGLVKGQGSDPGRLNKPTTGQCSRNNTSAKTASTPGPQSVTLNDDLLTCFLIDETLQIQDAINGTPNILSADIFKSPRFTRVPIIPTEAENGSSEFYPIIGFRPGFITDQSVTASAQSPGILSTYNGIDFQAGFVNGLHVIFFSEASLPEFAPAVGGEVAYTGSGTKVIVLVD